MGLDNYRNLEFEDTHLERLKKIWNGGREGLTPRDAAIIEASGRTSHNMALVYFCDSAEFRKWYDYCADVEMAMFWGEDDRYAWRGAWEVLSRRYRNALGGRVGKGGTGGRRGGVGKRVAQYDTDGNLIKVWESARAISRELGICVSSVSAVCHGTKCTAGGFVFRFEWCQPPEPVENPTPNKVYRKVVQMDRDGNILAVHGGLREASRATNVNYANISKCIRGVMKTAGGYRWKGVKDD